MKIRCEDHKGNVYGSRREMLAAYGISESTFSRRKLAGMPLHDILEAPKRSGKRCSRSIPCQDHKGNSYESKKDMLKAYGISRQVFHNRIKNGYTLQQALELPTGSRSPVNPKTRAAHDDHEPKYRDHLGNGFPSINAMCSYWHISPATYRSRVKTGCGLEDALTKPIGAPAPPNNMACADHAGNKFKTVKEMCKRWHVSTGTYWARIRAGFGVEGALTGNGSPAKAGHGGPRVPTPCIDHEGRSFGSVTEMCRYWHVSQATYRARIRAGYSLEDALTAKPRTNPQAIMCMDHKGQVFRSIREMCESYGISRAAFRKGIAEKRPLSEILEKNVK